jgi:hypothetical protein
VIVAKIIIGMKFWDIANQTGNFHAQGILTNGVFQAVVDVIQVILMTKQLENVDQGINL